MSAYEGIGDPVVVPGPNIRSLLTDTEAVDADTTELVTDEDQHRCHSCGRTWPGTALVCPDDGAALLALPSATRSELSTPRRLPRGNRP